MDVNCVAYALKNKIVFKVNTNCLFDINNFGLILKQPSILK